MRLVLGDQDLVLGPGEVAEFDTQVPHWFGSTGDEPAEVLSIFGRPGERMHVRAPDPRQEAPMADAMTALLRDQVLHVPQAAPRRSCRGRDSTSGSAAGADAG